MVRREIAPTSQALQVAFSRLFREPMLSESTSFGSRWGIYEMSSTNPASDQSPSYSPDGKKIAFESNRPDRQATTDYEIYTMNANGTGVKQLTSDSADDRNPAWSPGGKKIVFASSRDGNLEIYSMNSDGSNQTNLTNDSAYDRNPCYSPNGRQIAFQSLRDGNSEIYKMDTDPATTDATRLTNNTAYDDRPSWQPLH